MIRRRGGWAARAVRRFGWGGGLVEPTVLVALLIAFWEYASRSDLVSRVIVPPPSDVAPALVELVTLDFFFRHFNATVYEIGFGFACATLLGFGLAVALSFSSFLRKLLSPLVIAFDVIPRVALIPLIIIWFGVHERGKVVVVVMIAFFPIFLNSLSGLTEVDREGQTLLRSMGATALQRFRFHALPTALPSIFAGLRLGMTLAFIGAIVAELLTPSKGLGFLLITFKNQLQIELMFAITVLLGVMGSVIFFGMEALERKFVFWHGAESEISTL